MVYTALTKKAMLLAYQAHMGQIDKGGYPYIHHPLHLAEEMSDEYSTCAALLHDVVEDTALTFDDLIAEGIPDIVVDALRLLTHDDAVPYIDYVQQLKANPIARAVKLADLKHNSDLTRLENADSKVIKRVEKYQEAIRCLEDKSST